jgi:tetratricopeptide (TPR) repeat protein
MGVLYSGTEDYEKAIDNFNMALSYAVKNNDIIGKATYYNNIADVYLNKGDYGRARDFAGRSMKFNEQIGNKEGLSTNYMIYSYLMAALKKYDSAWYYIQKLDTLAQEQPNPAIVQGYYSTLYNYHKQREEYEKALDS